MENFLNEDKVNPDSLLQLFKNALMKAYLDEDSDIRVTTGLGSVFLIEVLSDQKMLKYVSMFGFKKHANATKKLTFLNQLNSGIILSRFSMPREDVLLSEYFLPYEEGISPYQVVNCLRLFERVTTGAIRQFDNDDLVE
ncbi:YbjN domain-containing protein [Candidatus Parabeggiatoa sp. HSG14]|uniref:YbjN domain-containing protein n=1 Tax=Candidatus Parabeggiatoa sp. HSG14 TaxID=3055593 RepID=UPI0032E47C21